MGFFGSLFGSKPAPKLYTGKILQWGEVRSRIGSIGSLAQLGKTQYAEVNSAAVIGLAQATRDALFAADVTRWSKTATCTLFASRFASLGQERFFRESFQDFISGQVIALAAGEVWFHPDSSRDGSDHAIGVCLTERGVLYIDPQLPDVLRPMSATELAQQRSLRFL